MNQGIERVRGRNSSGATVEWADAEGCITGDFVHYVMHLAASASGERCEVCTVMGPVQHA